MQVMNAQQVGQESTNILINAMNASTPSGRGVGKSPEEKLAYVTMFLRGNNETAVANHFGVSRSTVRGAVKRVKSAIESAYCKFHQLENRGRIISFDD